LNLLISGNPVKIWNGTATVIGCVSFNRSHWPAKAGKAKDKVPKARKPVGR
jgi:hypothetical protein